MNGNICRCGTYQRIVRAIERAAKEALSHEQRHSASRNDSIPPQRAGRRRAASRSAFALGGRRCASVLASAAGLASAAQSLGAHRAGRHDHHHVRRRRDGAGVDDLAAADRRRGAGRRLVEGQDRDRAADRGDLRQSGLPRHDVHRWLQRGDELLYATAHRRRAGAPRAARQRGADAGRAGRRTDHRAEHRRAREIRPASELRRDRRVRRRFRRRRRRSSPSSSRRQKTSG